MSKIKIDQYLFNLASGFVIETLVKAARKLEEEQRRMVTIDAGGIIYPVMLTREQISVL